MTDEIYLRDLRDFGCLDIARSTGMASGLAGGSHPSVLSPSYVITFEDLVQGFIALLGSLVEDLNQNVNVDCHFLRSGLRVWISESARSLSMNSTLALSLLSSSRVLRSSMSFSNSLLKLSSLL
jgi:hypothetical protein